MQNYVWFPIFAILVLIGTVEFCAHHRSPSPLDMSLRDPHSEYRCDSWTLTK